MFCEAHFLKAQAQGFAFKVKMTHQHYIAPVLNIFAKFGDSLVPFGHYSCFVFLFLRHLKQRNFTDPSTTAVSISKAAIKKHMTSTE